MKNSKIEASFSNRILAVRFMQNAVINADDLKEIYSYANIKSGGRRYGVLFESGSHYEVGDDALEYIADNPNNIHVIAKAYVLENKEAEIKTKLHIIFDHPALKPFTFSTHEEAVSWLMNAIDHDQQISISESK